MRRCASAASACCIEPERTPSSEWAGRTRRACSSERRRGRKRTPVASRSSAAPASCSTRCWPPSAWGGATSISRTSSSAGRRATAIPTPTKSPSCSGYLRRQIEAVSPRLLVATGRVAAQSLLSTTKPIGQLRGRTYRFGEDRLPVIVMYHPAYFLRSPLEKRKGWDDLVRLRAMLSDDGAGDP